MTINIDAINEKLLDERTDLSDNEKEFAKQVMASREMTMKAMQAEIDSVIKRYAEIEAYKVIELYNKYIKAVGAK